MQLREKSTEGVPATAAKRDSARTPRQPRRAIPVRLSGPSRSPHGKKGKQAALGRLQSPELCGPTASETEASKAQVRRYLVQLHFSQPGAAHLTHGHLPNIPRSNPCRKQLLSAGEWDAVLGDSWGPDLPGSSSTTEDRPPPILNQKRLPSVGSPRGTAWPGHGPWGSHRV